MFVNESDIVWHYLSDRMTAGIMLDVGAHHGSSCRPFLKGGWEVFAFEPDAQNRAQLQRLTATLPRLHIDPRAVSDAVRTGVPLYRSTASNGISALQSFDGTHVQAESVDTVTLADFCAERGVTRVDFLKVDAEGEDLPVLRAFPWERARPAVVMAEFEDRKTVPRGYTYRDAADLLVSHGYTVLISEWFPITAYGQAHAWRRFAPYPSDLADSNAWGNLIAFRDAFDWQAWSAAMVGAFSAQVADLDRWLKKNRAAARTLRPQVEALTREVAALRASRSWKLTAPLRWFGAGRQEKG